MLKAILRLFAKRPVPVLAERNRPERLLVFRKGHRFDDGTGSGFIATRDLYADSLILSSDWVGYGGRADPKVGDPVYDWFASQIEQGVRWAHAGLGSE